MTSRAEEWRHKPRNFVHILYIVEVPYKYYKSHFEVASILRPTRLFSSMLDLWVRNPDAAHILWNDLVKHNATNAIRPPQHEKSVDLKSNFVENKLKTNYNVLLTVKIGIDDFRCTLHQKWTATYTVFQQTRTAIPIFILLFKT